MPGNRWYVEAESSVESWKFVKDYGSDRKQARKTVAEFLQKWMSYCDHDDISMTDEQALLFTDTEKYPFLCDVREYFNQNTGDRIQLWEVNTESPTRMIAPFALTEGALITVGETA